ncbi:ankyrin repeat-containing protein BDA1-like [Rhododendron vialii]|uniref:ankyrin repeat-containing protein BDA1-like n=1 Tax=Rhododendron vialii TaxID=182163 RepID=UPI00265E2998|nr:ankyrin repeat-containing protein BDA1-like [Rhododendron vialii]
MDPNLINAAEARNIDALYESIELDPYILDKVDKIPFVHTPLHVAASTGQTRLAVEIMNLKPSLSRKLNPNGLSPLHLALLNGHFETVKGLVELDKDLVRVKGRGKLTPLHSSAETDDRVGILAEFLCACPESIEDQNVRGETALHIAVRNRNVRALGVLMGWILMTGKHWVWVKYIKDGRGNTILHMAVSTSRPDIVESVVRGYCKLNMNERNLEGATALDVAERLAAGFERTKIESSLRCAGALKSSSLASDCSVVDFLISQQSWVENVYRFYLLMRKGMSMEMRNAAVVVAALITTTTFQAVLSPPGGLGGGDSPSDDNSPFANINATSSTSSLLPTTNISRINATIFTSTNKHPNPFLPMFYAMNTTAFLASIAMIILVLPFRVFAMVHGSLIFLTLCYGISFMIIPQMHNFDAFFAISSPVIASLLYMVYFIPNMMEDRFEIDKRLGRHLLVSRLQGTRLRMLYRVAH